MESKTNLERLNESIMQIVQKYDTLKSEADAMRTELMTLKAEREMKNQEIERLVEENAMKDLEIEEIVNKIETILGQ